MKNKNEKKQEIIKAAAKVFSRDGLHEARVEDIAKEAKIGKGTIYLYFNDKEDILQEGIRFFAHMRVKKLKNLISKYSSPREKLSTLLNLSIKISKKNPDIFFMNYAALLSTHKDLRSQAVLEFFIQYIALVEEIIREGVRSKDFRKINTKVVALSIVLTQDLSTLLLSKKISMIESEQIANELLKLIST